MNTPLSPKDFPNDASDITTKKQNDLASAKELVEIINHGTGVARALYLAFLGFTAFLLIITSTTDDLDLLLLTPITIPLFSIEVDLTGFYRFAPWAYTLAHLNLLVTLAMLSGKLKLFHDTLSLQAYDTRQKLRNSLHIFAPIQYMAGQQAGVVRFILWVISRIVLVVLPPVTLLWLQIDFLAVQDAITVFSQRAALLVDAVFTYFLWKTMLQGQARPLSELRLPGSRRPALKRQKMSQRTTAVALGIIVIISLGGATIPLSDWERKVVALTSSQSFADCDPSNPVVISEYPQNCTTFLTRWLFDGEHGSGLRAEFAEAIDKTVVSQKHGEYRDCRISSSPANGLPLCWFAGRRTLFGFQGKVMVSKPEELSIETINSLNSESSIENLENILISIKGLDLSNRNFRFAGFSSTTLPNANLSGTNAQGVDLAFAQLYGANFNEAKLQGSIFWKTSLHSATLISAKLNGASLIEAELHSADLFGAELHDAKLAEAKLHNANLIQAELLRANLSEAELYSADFTEAKLHGADLRLAKLHSANLTQAELYGAGLPWAELQGANLTEAKLHGTNLSNAKLHGANLFFAELYGSTLKWASLHGADLEEAKLGGTDLSGAFLHGAVLPYLDSVDLRWATMDTSWQCDLRSPITTTENPQDYTGCDILKVHILRQARSQNQGYAGLAKQQMDTFDRARSTRFFASDCVQSERTVSSANVDLGNCVAWDDDLPSKQAETMLASVRDTMINSLCTLPETAFTDNPWTNGSLAYVGVETRQAIGVEEVIWTTALINPLLFKPSCNINRYLADWWNGQTLEEKEVWAEELWEHFGSLKEKHWQNILQCKEGECQTPTSHQLIELITQRAEAALN